MHAPTWHSTVERYKKMFQRRDVALITCAWCLLFILSALTASSGQLRPIAFGMASSISGQFLPRDEHGHTNILLLGVGDRLHPGADLTDSIMIASIDPSSKSMVLLSLPRDLAIVDPDAGTVNRINILYYNYKNHWKRKGATASGVSLLAMRSMADDLGARLGMSIQGVAKVDFTAFTEIIDAFGGVEIDVPKSITDYTYPLEEGVVGTYSVTAGMHRFDGEEALRYARSRHSTSDFDRSSRQQQILGALVEKIAAQNPLDNLGLASSVLQSIEKHAEWTLSAKDIMAIGGTVLGIPRYRIVSMHMTTRVGGDATDSERGGFVVAGGSAYSGAILLPYSRKGDPTDWSQLRTLASLLTSKREFFLDPSVISIAADPSSIVQAHRLRNDLVRYGFHVPGDIIKTPVAGSGGVMAGRSGKTSEFLGGYTGMPATMSGSMRLHDIRIAVPKGYKFSPMAH